MSALLAPIRMLFHTRFVVMALLGRSVQWKSPPREDAQTSWGEAIRRHGLHTLFGIAWAAVVWWLNPSFLWWLLPVAGALILSIPVSVYTSRAILGERMRHLGLFLIPEETQPPPEIAATQRYVANARAAPLWIDAVVDPRHNAVMAALAVPRPDLPVRVREERRALVERALAEGPDALSAREKMILLADPIALSLLHFRVWTVPRVHPAWRVAEGITAPQPQATAG